MLKLPSASVVAFATTSRADAGAADCNSSVTPGDAFPSAVTRPETEPRAGGEFWADAVADALSSSAAEKAKQARACILCRFLIRLTTLRPA